MSSFRDNDITTPWPRELSDIASVSLCLLILFQCPPPACVTLYKNGKGKEMDGTREKRKADKQGMVTLQDDVTLRDLYRADRYQHTNERS
jgi:hypothetical protein